MKLLKELAIYFGITFISEIIAKLLPINIPPSIIGIVILFVLLELKVLKTEDVEMTGDYLIKIMPILFVPAGVGLIKYLDVLKIVAVPMVFVITLSTAVVMTAVGVVTQKLVEKKK
ncbi:MAG: CidA/LrgA family protein [Ezakiella sp.]